MSPNIYVIQYLEPPPSDESDIDRYPKMYDVFVIAMTLKDAIDSADLYRAKDGDIVHGVACHSRPPMTNLRFTSAVRSAVGHARSGGTEHG